MKQTFRLGNIWGIPIGLHSSWLIIFLFITYSLAVGYMPQAYPDLTTPTYWLLGAITSLLFFGSVLFHELAHAWVALRHGMSVNRITLFLFGGVAEMEEESPSASAEFWVAIAGPISSLFLAVAFYGLYLVDRPIDWLAAPTQYLATINLLLALFNMIPGFPLDGGRVLRAAIWKFTDYERGTRIATRSGQVVAVLFLGLGIAQMVMGGVFDGLWLIFIAWFLFSSATAYRTHVNLSSLLDGTPVENIMSVEWREIDGNLPISQLVDDQIMRGGPRYYFVRYTNYGEETDSPHGMLTTSDISRLGREQWRFTPAARLMTAWHSLVTIEPHVSLMNALRQMDERKINQLPVLREGTLVGVLTRDNIARFLRGQHSFPRLSFS